MFAGELAERVQTVDAIDRSPEMIERAQANAPVNVRCILGDVASVRLPSEQWLSGTGEYVELVDASV